MGVFSAGMAFKTMILGRFHQGCKHTEKRRNPRTNSSCICVEYLSYPESHPLCHTFFQSLLRQLAAAQVQPSVTDFISAALCVFCFFSRSFLWPLMGAYGSLIDHSSVCSHQKVLRSVNSHEGKPWPAGYIDMSLIRTLTGLSLG